MYIDVSLYIYSENHGLEFSKLSFKVRSICLYASTTQLYTFTKSSDMLSKNTLDVKRCEANGCKKVRGQLEAALPMCGQNL